MAKLLEAYHPPDNTYDEMVTATGQERETWDALLETLRVLNPSEFTHRWDLARRHQRRAPGRRRDSGSPCGKRPAPPGTHDLDLA